MFSLLLIIHYNWIVIQNLEVNFLFPKLKFGPTFVNLTDVHKTSLINCSFSICIWKMAEGKTLSLPPFMDAQIPATYGTVCFEKTLKTNRLLHVGQVRKKPDCSG